MKAKKSTKRLKTAKKLELTKPLTIQKFVDKASPK